MARHLARWELDGVDGAVVAIDVIRAFTTAAYAFGSGATEIFLVGTVDEALAFTASNSGSLALGEDRVRRPDGFDFPNSPAMVGRADLAGRTLVQRTSAGTQGVVCAVHATRLWAASLVVASATARAVEASGLGEPAYVITGRFEDRPDGGADDVLTADLVERARTDRPLEAAATAAALLATEEAAKTLALGLDHCDSTDGGTPQVGLPPRRPAIRARTAPECGTPRALIAGNGSGVGGVEHLQLFPGDGDVADHAPLQSATRAGSTDLDPLGAQRPCRAVRVSDGDAAVVLDAGDTPDDPSALVVASEPDRFTHSQPEPGERSGRPVHVDRCRQAPMVRRCSLRIPPSQRSGSVALRAM